MDETGQHTWTLRVASGGGPSAKVYARRHTFEVGAPVSFDRDYGQVSALEHLLGAVGADLVNGFVALARRKRLEVDRVEARVEGRLGNPLVALGVVGERGDPGLERI